METSMKTVTKTVKKTARPILLCLLVSLSGCFSLSKGAPALKHYVLGAGGHAERAPRGAVVEVEPGSAPTALIGLRPPSLADYLANSYIVVRRGIHRVGFSEFDRWGEDLARGVGRTLAGHMAARSPAHRVEAAPWPPGTRPEKLIQVHLLRFEGVAPEDTLAVAGEAHLLANWEILDAADGALLLSGTTEVRSAGWTVGDFDGLVGLLDAALDALAEDLVLGMERVPASSGGPGPH